MPATDIIIIMSLISMSSSADWVWFSAIMCSADIQNGRKSRHDRQAACRTRRIYHPADRRTTSWPRSLAVKRAVDRTPPAHRPPKHAVDRQQLCPGAEGDALFQQYEEVKAALQSPPVFAARNRSPAVTPRRSHRRRQ